MVARHGDFTRAIELTREMDKTVKDFAGRLLAASPALHHARATASMWHRLTRKPSSATRASSTSASY